MNMGHYTRNTAFFGDPLGTDTSDPSTVNAIFSPQTIVSGILRHTAVHTISGLPHLDGVAERCVRFAHNIVEANIDDERTTFGLAKYSTATLTRNEDTASNPLHFLLILISSLILITSKKLRSSRNALTYLVCVVGAYCLFCATIRWQIYVSRLHLPVFLITTPIAALVLTGISRRWIPQITAALLLLLSIPYVIANETRPLLGANSILRIPRIDQYVTIVDTMPPSWTGAVEFVVSRNVRSVGLLVPLHFREYAVWAILDEVGESTPRMEFVAVSNSSSNLCRNPRYGEFIPDAIIAIRRELPGSYREDTSLNYVEAWGKDDARVYVLENTP
jgi:hypothetical protein